MDLQELFPTVPKRLTTSLIKHYKKIKENFLENRYDPSEINGAKFSEVVIRILQWHTSQTNSYTPLGTKINNFDQATRQFENKTIYPDAIRFHIPKLLNVIYTIRNKRGVGHVGGDIDPNHMDSLFIVNATDWIMAELIRIFHTVTVSEASAMIESIITRRIPLVWEVEGRKRILQQNLSYKDKVLILLYSEYPNPTIDNSLFEWSEHSNISNFRRDVLKGLHKEKLIEYDLRTKKVYLSPTGLHKVEEKILSNTH